MSFIIFLKQLLKDSVSSFPASYSPLGLQEPVVSSYPMQAGWGRLRPRTVAISFISKGISQRSQGCVLNLLHNQTLMQTHNCLKPWEATNHLQQLELSNHLLTIFSKEEEVGLSRPKQARLQSVPEGKQCQELPGTHTSWLGRRPVKGLFSCSKTFIYRVMSLKCMGCNSRNSATNLLNFLKYLYI